MPSSLRPRSRNFIRILAEHGHQVTLIAVQNQDPQNEAVRRYCERVLSVPNPLAPALRRCLAALPTRTPLQAAYGRAPELERTFAEVIATGSYDIVHIEHLRAAVAALGIKSIPVVFDAVDAMTVLWRKNRRLGSWTRRAIAVIEAPRIEAYERRLLREFTTCLVSSQLDGAELERLAPGARVVSIPNVCDVAALARVNRHPRRARIVFVGRMSYEPNVVAVEDFVSEVLPRIAPGHNDLEFRIVGSSPHGRVRRLMHKPNVHVTGFVADIRTELAEATVSVCNVRVAGGAQNKILESLAAAVPVVTTRSTAEALGLRHREHVMIADQPRATAEAINVLLDDAELARRIAENGQVHAQRHFSLEVAAAGLLSEYQRCLKAESPGVVAAAGC
jgi:glycosyltransferase involved in cell wall biosynthesis